jgi:sulfite exporter TauE/SafE
MTLLAAFLVGLLGSVHCLGMCGGIVSALTLGLDDAARRSPLRLFPHLLSYNAGRIVSYAAAGAIAGAFSAQVLDLLPPAQAMFVARVISGGFMILLGLYLAGWWPALNVLERWGGVLWRRIEPLGRRMLPVRNPAQALGVGLVWGWLPCGMVYSALVWALASGSAAQGAMLMIAFGLGTVPMLFAIGATAERLNRFVRQPRVRQLAGAIVIAFGVLALLGVAGQGGHDGHDPASHHSLSPQAEQLVG